MYIIHRLYIHGDGKMEEIDAIEMLKYGNCPKAFLKNVKIKSGY